MEANSKVWDRDAVQALIATNDAALSKALWTIFQRQTPGEQSTLTTIARNGRGFNANDAETLSDIAKRLPRYDFNLTIRQRKLVRGRLKKYWRQLLEEIEAKGGTVSYRVAKASKPAIANSQMGDPATLLDDDIAEALNSEVPAPALTSDVLPSAWGSF